MMKLTWDTGKPRASDIYSPKPINYSLSELVLELHLFIILYHQWFVLINALNYPFTLAWLPLLNCFEHIEAFQIRMCWDVGTLQHVCKTREHRKPSETSESMETIEPCEFNNNSIDPDLFLWDTMPFGISEKACKAR